MSKVVPQLGRAGAMLSIAVFVVLLPTAAAAQNRPANQPPYNEHGPYVDFYGAYRGPDYRLKVFSEGLVIFQHDDGSVAAIELNNISINEQSRPEWINKRIALGRVGATEGSGPPLGAWITLQSHLDPVKGSRAMFTVHADAPGYPIVYRHFICHPVVGNGAWEVYPCWN